MAPSPASNRILDSSVAYQVRRTSISPGCPAHTPMNRLPQVVQALWECIELGMGKSVHTADYQVLLELLVETRKAAEVRQVDLAETLGTSQSIVNKVETGDLRLDVVQLRIVCQAIGVPLSGFVAKLEERLAGVASRRKRRKGGRRT